MLLNLRKTDPFNGFLTQFHGPKKERAFAAQLTKPVLEKLAQSTGELPTTVGVVE